MFFLRIIKINGIIHLKDILNGQVTVINKEKDIENLMLYNGNIATTEMLRKIGIKDYEISRLTNNCIKRVGRGIYKCFFTNDEEINNLDYILAVVPKAIFCMKTALRFYKYIQEVEYEIAVPRSLAPSKRSVPNTDVRYYYIKDKFHEIGKTMVMLGNRIPIYDRERTIFDCFKHHTEFCYEELKSITEKYLADPEKNLEKLNEYVDLMSLSVAARKKMKAMGLPIRRISPQKK